MGSFQMISLPVEPFAPLFDESDPALREKGVRRLLADESPGYPCRVSLADAEVGETVLLLPFTYHDVASPYRASGPIFVRQGARRAAPLPGDVPPMFRHRLQSVRAYDAEAMMVGAEVVAGTDLEGAIMRLFARSEVDYLHVHNASPGCFNCRVIRA